MSLLNKRLLQDTVIKHKNEVSSTAKQDLQALFKDTLNRIESGKFKKEESEKVPFLQRLFELLGYKLHENLEFEYSTQGRSIDGVLGLQTEKGRDVEVAIEWKGIDTKNLNSGKAGETPVSQMWDYMGKVGAEIGIVGNFLEFRIYTLKTKQTEYQEYFLRELANQDDKLDEFIFILKKETLLRNENKQSLLETLISQSEAQQEQITKRFYSDYKQRRLILFQHLVEINPEINKHLLLEKSQKILDRLVFIMFCEDGSLIPSGTIKNTYTQARESILPTPTKIWDFFKGLFLAIDKGNDYPKINAFNGGLFAEDSDLNNLIIRDTIWQDLIKLAEYDFESDLNVNILGHIFEQSISDIEEIKNEIEGEDTDKKKSKRKKDGIYYTPEYITDYIVSETIGSWLNQESNQLETIKVLDPAGGSGAFPNQVHNYLARKHVEQIKNKAESEGFDPNLIAIDEKVIDKSILQNNIFMVDLQPESVEIAKLSLWLKTAKKDQKLNNLDENVKCGNSLKINWTEYFVLTGFDVILGNPPYIKEYTNKSAFDGLHDNPYYQGKMDLWTMFACIAIDELKEGGYLAFIAPNNWISNAGASILRDKILSDGELQTFIDFGDFKVFEDAGIQTMVFVFKKGNPRNKYTVNYARVEDKNISLENIKLLLSSKLTADIDGIIKFQAEIEPVKLKGKNLSFVNKSVDQILEKMEEKREFVLKENEVGQGIVAAPDKCFLVDKIDIFITQERSYLKPYFTASSRYETAESSNYIFYISNKNFKSNDLDNHPNIKAHFEPNKEILTEAKIKYETPNKPYFFLHREREERFFEKGEKIVCAIRTEKPSFYYTESEYYGSRALNFIKTDRINLKYLTAILNSNIVYFWLKHKGKLLGDLLQIDKAPLLNIPIPQATETEQIQIAELVDQIMQLKANSQSLTNSFLKLVTSKYKPITISTKLKNWHKFEIVDFLDELKKQKAVIGGLSAESELMEYFEEQKVKVLEVEKEVERVDLEIEGLVRGLYKIE